MLSNFKANEVTHMLLSDRDEPKAMNAANDRGATPEEKKNADDISTIRWNGNSWSTFFRKMKKSWRDKHPITCRSIPDQDGITKCSARCFCSKMSRTRSQVFYSKMSKTRFPFLGSKPYTCVSCQQKWGLQNSTPCSNKLHSHYFHGKNVDWKRVYQKCSTVSPAKKATKKPQPFGYRVEASLIVLVMHYYQNSLL